jgi:hypothetical protein
MKLFGAIVLAGVISFFAGLVITIAASLVLPCGSEKAGCGIGDAYRILFVPIYAIAGMIAFGISAPGKSRERPLKLTMLTLVLVSVFLAVFAIGSDINNGRPVRLGTLLELLQVLLPFWAVVLIQWRIIRGFVLERDVAQQAVS